MANKHHSAVNRVPQSPQSGAAPLHSPNQHHERTHSLSAHHPHQSSRKPAIVDLLSSPPPLPAADHDDINSFNLSRTNSISSRSASIASKDWSEVVLTELIESNKLISISKSYSVQKSFETLVTHNLTSVPVSITDDPANLNNCLTFDYSDLNTYLLLVMNKIGPSDLNAEESAAADYGALLQKAKRGEEVPVDFIIKLHPKNPFIKFSERDNLLAVTEVLGNGVHRIAITCAQEQNKIVGILSQRRLVRYLWENARRFPSLEVLFNSTLQELKIGSSEPITIYEDQHLIDALHKMFVERISSLAVIDRKGNLFGNISIVDVKNVSSSKNSHLLFKSVTNFISYNLSQKGIEEGKDQFPIFHVNQANTLGRVLAKLVATQSHRLWVVESTSNPVTIEDTLNNPANSNEHGLPGTLIGVVTLTDILGLLAASKSNGRKIDPQFARNQRRRSSTSTTRSSFEASSSGAEMFRK